MTPTMIVLGFLLPPVVVGVVMGLWWLAGRGRGGGLVAAAAMGVGYGCAHWGLIGAARWPARPTDHGFLYGAAAAMVAGMALSMVVGRGAGARVLRMVVRIVTVGVVVGFLGWVRWTLDRAWSGAELVEWGAFVVSAVVFWTLVERAAGDDAEKGDGWDAMTAALVASAAAGISAPMLVLGGAVQFIGMVSGAIALMMLAMAAAMKVGKCSAREARGAVALTGAIVPGLWMFAGVWSELHYGYALGMAAAACAALVVNVGAVKRMGGWKRMVVRVGAAALAFGVVAAIAVMNAPLDEYAGY